MKVAIFDFCETLVSFQTADEFIKFSAKRRSKAKFYICETFRFVLRKLRMLNGSANKRFLLRYMKGMTRNELDQLAEEFYKSAIKGSFIENTLDRLVKLKATGYKIIIISGGYENYIQYFADEFNCDEVIATRIEIKDDLVTGRFDGLNCMGVNKLYKLNDVIDISSINYNDSYTFSDHDSDIYIFSLVKNKIAIRRDGHNQKWVNLLGFTFLE